MIAPRHFDVKRSGDVTELRLADPSLFDVRHYEELQDDVVGYVEHQRPGKLIVDFSDVGYCSTAVIAAMLIVKRNMESRGGRIKLCEMSDEVREAFRTLKLDGTIFDILSTKADAAEAF